MRKSIWKISYYLIGTTFLSFGIALAILSGIGAGAFDALNSNLSELLNITVGYAMYISIFTVYLLIMILKPRFIYIFGYFLTFLVGLGIDLCMGVIPSIGDNFILGILYFVVSLLLLPIGVSFFISSKLPLSPMDNLLLILLEKTNMSISKLKTIIETCFAIIALIFGILAGIGFGNLSIGTIIITLLIGPSIQFTMKFIKQIES